MNGKTCPFCGESDDLMVVQIDIEDREGVPAAIACGTCGAQGPSKYIPVEYGLDSSVAKAMLFEMWDSRKEVN